MSRPIFIELHFESGTPILTNINAISQILPHDKGAMVYTLLTKSNHGESYQVATLVNESYDEVKKLIGTRTGGI